MRNFCATRGHRGLHHEHGECHRHPSIRADHAFGGGGGRRERIFASGDLKLVALHLLAQKPGHGYDLIKSLSELVGGDYSPSPGTIYPTLTLLEDLGWVTSLQDGSGRKIYAISGDGKAQLETEKENVDRILAHLSHCRARANARRVPEIVRAMENLKLAMRMRFGDSAPDPVVTRRVAEIIDRAATEIDRI